MDNWLTWEYMFSKLEGVMLEKMSDDLITEEEYESYMDDLQLMDRDQMEREYDAVFEAARWLEGEDEWLQ